MNLVEKCERKIAWRSVDWFSYRAIWKCNVLSRLKYLISLIISPLSLVFFPLPSFLSSFYSFILKPSHLPLLSPFFQSNPNPPNRFHLQLQFMISISILIQTSIQLQFNDHLRLFRYFHWFWRFFCQQLLNLTNSKAKLSSKIFYLKRLELPISRTRTYENILSPILFVWFQIRPSLLLFKSIF